MPSLVFRKCCGCIDLKIGSYIIAYLILVASLIKSLGSLVVIIFAAALTNDNMVVMTMFCIVLILDVGLHQIIWAALMLTLIAQPAIFNAQLPNSPAGTMAFLVIFILAAIGISVLLLLGIIKNNQIFIKVFLSFNLVMIVIFVMSIIYYLYSQPTTFGLSGFFSVTFVILLYVLTYFVIRNYYLGLIKPKRHIQNNSPRGMGV